MTSKRGTSALVALAVICAAAPALAGYESVPDFAPNPGALNMYRYVPEDLPPGPRPLVVAMHGCSQNAAAYRAAGWEPLADAHGFLVVYPEQRAANNAAGCFNWAGEYGVPTNLRRGEGENRSIVAMVERMQADFEVDPDRVFVTGMSAGGAQTALMMATWPDVFAAGAPIAGIPYNCTTQFLQVSTCLSPGIPRAPDAWAQLVFDAFPDFDGDYPRVSIWQGANDFFVNPINQTEMLEQWSEVHGIDREPDGESQVGPATRRAYADGAGDVVIETWTVGGAGHGVFIDSASGCGGPPSAYVLDAGICSSLHIARFFGILDDGEGPDNGAPVEDPDPSVADDPAPPADAPPTDDPAPPAGGPAPLELAFLAPTRGAILDGPFEVELEVTGGVEILHVLLFVDDGIVGHALRAPWAFTLDATGWAAGPHQLKAQAVDAAGAAVTRALNVVRAEPATPPDPATPAEPARPADPAAEPETSADEGCCALPVAETPDPEPQPDPTPDRGDDDTLGCEAAPAPKGRAGLGALWLLVLVGLRRRR
jgi:poly(hydroxyalkanoate) depolymerase family esterase